MNTDGIPDDRHLWQVSTTHRFGNNLRFRLLQNARERGLSLFPPQVSRRRLLGIVHTGRTEEKGEIQKGVKWKSKIHRSKTAA